MNKIFRFIALFEAILTLFIVFILGNKIDKQDIVIDNQKNIIATISKENIRLRLVEQDFEESKEIIGDCFKDISIKASDNDKGK
jgi:hypothetical protein